MQQSIYITLFLVLTVSLAGAQSFGLPGTRWSYCWTLSVIESPPSTYIVETMSGPTFERNGMQCNTLHFSSDNYVGIGASISICREGDRVFYLDGDTSYLLYDFSLGMGDTLVVRYPHAFDPSYAASRPDDDDIFELVIDSVSVENLAGVALKKQHIHGLNEDLFVSFGSYILERVGFEYWILPYFGYEALDGNGFLGLRNYMDDQVFFEDVSVCDTRVSINIENRIDRIV